MKIDPKPFFFLLFLGSKKTVGSNKWWVQTWWFLDPNFRGNCSSDRPECLEHLGGGVDGAARLREVPCVFFDLGPKDLLKGAKIVSYIEKSSQQ